MDGRMDNDDDDDDDDDVLAFWGQLSLSFSLSLSDGLGDQATEVLSNHQHRPPDQAERGRCDSAQQIVDDCMPTHYSCLYTRTIRLTKANDF